MKKVWILTSEVNDYNQHGEYFEKMFFEEPTIKELQEITACTKEYCQHILNGGGRQEDEYVWYNLSFYSEKA